MEVAALPRIVSASNDLFMDFLKLKPSSEEFFKDDDIVEGNSHQVGNDDDANNNCSEKSGNSNEAPKNWEFHHRSHHHVDDDKETLSESLDENGSIISHEDEEESKENQSPKIMAFDSYVVNKNRSEKINELKRQPISNKRRPSMLADFKKITQIRRRQASSSQDESSSFSNSNFKNLVRFMRKRALKLNIPKLKVKDGFPQPKIYKCNICEDHFYHAVKYLKHIRRYHYQATLRCEICLQDFRKHDDLQHHQRKIRCKNVTLYL